MLNRQQSQQQTGTALSASNLNDQISENGSDEMAKFPDGHVFIYKPKRKKIEIEEHELVMCKNCKHRDPEDHKCDHHWHAYSPLPVDDDFWCAYGEKYK